ncbi:helix-turn-helix domain-containing protein [Metabacillus halosaccharovorans]|uniref:helix-turn-helix domain-containing protein n=1 Tax=Metabacillus halosaccharovorans TaxID=930124 RepID=UPI0020412F9C|nr:helix-turn-helix transcriptional regulator [Metabacillus halosaccharovorans]MCM3444354.1 helix-turn-helix domain-containing protein [Metabacillus halosaccharovorans]
MYRPNFDGDIGEYLHLLRRSKKVNSTDLSKAVGKSAAYISQIENGRNKNPDYKTMYEILKHLGIEENKIEDYLLHFYIKSPEREAWEEKQAILAMQPPTEEDFEEWQKQAEFHEEQEKQDIHDGKVDQVFKKYFDETSEDDLVYDMIKENIKHMVYVFDDMVEHDLNNAFDLITGLGKVFDEVPTNENLYKFMIKLFSTKVPSLDEKGMLKVLNTLYEELNRVETERTKFGKPQLRQPIKEL